MEVRKFLNSRGERGETYLCWLGELPRKEWVGPSQRGKKRTGNSCPPWKIRLPKAGKTERTKDQPPSDNLPRSRRVVNKGGERADPFTKEEKREIAEGG